MLQPTNNRQLPVRSPQPGVEHVKITLLQTIQPQLCADCRPHHDAEPLLEFFLPPLLRQPYPRLVLAVLVAFIVHVLELVARVLESFDLLKHRARRDEVVGGACRNGKDGVFDADGGGAVAKDVFFVYAAGGHDVEREGDNALAVTAGRQGHAGWVGGVVVWRWGKGEERESPEHGADAGGFANVGGEVVHCEGFEGVGR